MCAGGALLVLLWYNKSTGELYLPGHAPGWLYSAGALVRVGGVCVLAGLLRSPSFFCLHRITSGETIIGLCIPVGT